jgi:hypothetical protein
MLPVAPITAMVCFVLIFIFLIRQNYHRNMPRSIAFAQEKALTFVNASGQELAINFLLISETIGSVISTKFFYLALQSSFYRRPSRQHV